MRKCTLIGAKHVLADERIYCINRNGKMNQTRAIEYCKDINATLPLPVSLLEFETFSNFSGPDKAWIGISDPSNSGKKENWRDGHNKKPAYVKPRVKTLDDFFKASYRDINLRYKNTYDLVQTILSGTRQSQTEMAQQHIIMLQASLTRTKAKIISLSVFKRLHVSTYIDRSLILY